MIIMNKNAHISHDDRGVHYIDDADDAKIFKVDLQAVMNSVKNWSDEWLLKLNADKCKTVSYYLKSRSVLSII